MGRWQAGKSCVSDVECQQCGESAICGRPIAWFLRLGGLAGRIRDPLHMVWIVRLYTCMWMTCWLLHMPSQSPWRFLPSDGLAPD